MFKVGVTGGIGSGKSIICNVFRHLDIPVYQADIEARRLMGENESIRTGLLTYFGGEVFQDEQLNRKYLACCLKREPGKSLITISLLMLRLKQG
jgi:dephospho-CoA kinase